VSLHTPTLSPHSKSGRTDLGTQVGTHRLGRTGWDAQFGTRRLGRAIRDAQMRAHTCAHSRARGNTHSDTLINSSFGTRVGTRFWGRNLTLAGGPKMGSKTHRFGTGVKNMKSHRFLERFKSEKKDLRASMWSMKSGRTSMSMSPTFTLTSSSTHHQHIINTSSSHRQHIITHFIPTCVYTHQHSVHEHVSSEW
jgi:hypothetical protein